MTHQYTSVLDRQPDGGFHVSCPALPDCHTQGDTLDEAVARAREAIADYLESLRAHGEPLRVADILDGCCAPSADTASPAPPHVAPRLL